MATIESLAEVSVSRHEPSTHAQSVKNISVDKRIFFGIMIVMNEEKVMKSCREIMGLDALEYCLDVGYDIHAVLNYAALKCFDTNRTDEHAEVIRQARKELAE